MNFRLLIQRVLLMKFMILNRHLVNLYHHTVHYHQKLLVVHHQQLLLLAIYLLMKSPLLNNMVNIQVV